MKLIAHVITYFLPNADPIMVAYWLALAMLIASVIWTKLKSQAVNICDWHKLNLQHSSNERPSTLLEVSCQ